MSDVASGTAADVKGGGGQRTVQKEIPQSGPSSSFPPLCSFSGGDPTVSSNRTLPCFCFLICLHEHFSIDRLFFTRRCFRPVSRTEAEVLLERHPDCGNMLLRPGRDGCSLAVTTRQDLNGLTPAEYLYT